MKASFITALCLDMGNIHTQTAAIMRGSSGA